MAIEFEQPRVSLINANSLPNASANVRVPDFGAGLARLGRTLAARDQEATAEREVIEAQTAASTFVGIDENGNYQAWPERTFQSKEGRDAYDRAITSIYANQFELGLSNQFNEIQGENIPAGQRAQRMQAALEERIKVISSSAPRLAAPLRARGLDLLQQRNYNMMQQEIAQNDRNTIEGLKVTIETATRKGSDAAAAGLNPQEQIDIATKAIDDLRALNKIDETSAKQMKAQIGETVVTSGVIRSVTDQMFMGGVDPQAVDNFAIAIENGTTVDLTVTPPTRDDDFRAPRPSFKMNSDDVRLKVTDPRLRSEIAVQLRKAAQEQKAMLADVAKHIELRSKLTRMGTIDGRFDVLPDHLHDDFEHLAANILDKGNVFGSVQGQATMIDLMRDTKRMPKAMVKTLVNMARSSDTRQMETALSFFHVARTLKNKYGDPVGDAIISTMPDEDLNFLGALADGLEAGYDMRELQDAVRSIKSPLNKVSMSDRIANYREVTDKNFYVEMRAKLRENLGDFIPLEAEEMFKTAYNINMAVLGNPQQAFDKAVERVSPRFTKSDIFLRGTAKAKIDQLTNPVGYKAKQRTFFGNNANDFDWLEGWMQDDVLSRLDSIVVADETKGIGGLTQDDIRAAFGGTSQAYLGKNVFLTPTDTNNLTPEFYVSVKKDGVVHHLEVVNEQGTPEPLIVQPYAAHAAASAKLEQERKIQGLQDAEQGAALELRTRILNQNGLVGFEGLHYAADEEAFQEWLSMQPEPIQQRYQQKLDDITKGTIEQIRKLNQLPGEEPAPASTPPNDQQGSIGTGSFDVGTLLSPRLSGYDVAQSAVAAIDSVVPDGTNGQFMLRVAAQESKFGAANGTFRMTGDKGIWQVNTGTGFREVQRRIAMGKGRVFEAAQKIKNTLGIDLANATPDDLDKPLVGAAFARLYFLGFSATAPTDLTQQAAYWKRYYNTSAGAGRPDQFIANASLVKGSAAAADPNAATAQADLPEDDDIIISPAGLGYQLKMEKGAKPQPVALQRGGGVIISSANGQPDPANFRALNADVQEKAKVIASAFGQPLRITPQGGTQPDKRGSGSQHKGGRALDVYVADYSDDEKAQLIAVAIANDAMGIGGYGGTSSGAGTLHIDFRTSKGKQPDGMAIWWRNEPNKDLPADEGPWWFREGIRRGRLMRDRKKKGTPV